MIDREKVIKGLELCTKISPDVCLMLCPYKDEKDETYSGFCEQVLKQDALALLKEQEEQVQQWTKEIADNQLAHAQDELDRENWDYKKGIWDGLQIAWNIISEGR
jgi:hypothetical protein